MKYAVIKIGASQYKASEGDELEVEKLQAEKGKTLEFDQVLLYVDADQVKIGQPLVKGAKVKAKVLDQYKCKKIRVATYKAKARYRRVKGHRKHLTKLRVEKISFASSRKTSGSTKEK